MYPSIARTICALCVADGASACAPSSAGARRCSSQRSRLVSAAWLRSRRSVCLSWRRSLSASIALCRSRSHSRNSAHARSKRRPPPRACKTSVTASISPAATPAQQQLAPHRPRNRLGVPSSDLSRQFRRRHSVQRLCVRPCLACLRRAVGHNAGGLDGASKSPGTCQVTCKGIPVRCRKSARVQGFTFRLTNSRHTLELHTSSPPPSAEPRPPVPQGSKRSFLSFEPDANILKPPVIPFLDNQCPCSTVRKRIPGSFKNLRPNAFSRIHLNKCHNRPWDAVPCQRTTPDNSGGSSGGSPFENGICLTAMAPNNKALRTGAILHASFVIRHSSFVIRLCQSGSP